MHGYPSVICLVGKTSSYLIACTEFADPPVSILNFIVATGQVTTASSCMDIRGIIHVDYTADCRDFTCVSANSNMFYIIYKVIYYNIILIAVVYHSNMLYVQIPVVYHITPVLFVNCGYNSYTEQPSLV